MPDLSRRHIVTAAAALPPLALPAAVLPAAALPPAAVRSAIDREAMAIRAKQIVDVLGRCYVREGWKLNTERAAQFVESVRTFDGEREDGYCAKFEMALDWMDDHGQSLDWLFIGRIDETIATLAALRATVSVIPDPIIAALADHRRLRREWNSLCTQLDRAEAKVQKTERRPFTLIAWRNHTAIGYSEIEVFRDELLAAPGADRKKIQQEYRKAKADERAARRAERDWYKRHGLADLKSETRPGHQKLRTMPGWRSRRLGRRPWRGPARLFHTCAAT